MDSPFYIKSFEEDFTLKTVVGKDKIKAQSLQNMLKTGAIKPNTLSFGQQKRLACSIVHSNYQKTYRSQGLIFQTEGRPIVIYPFDVVLLTDAKKMVVQYYRIKDKLHEYYKHKLIKGSEQFAFKDFGEMFKKFPNQESAWNAVNKFRIGAGYYALPKPKHKLVEYCEVIFNRPIKIKPVAIYGYTKASRGIAAKFGLPHFSSARKFYERAMLKPNLSPKRKTASPKAKLVLRRRNK